MRGVSMVRGEDMNTQCDSWTPLGVRWHRATCGNREVGEENKKLRLVSSLQVHGTLSWTFLSWLVGLVTSGDSWCWQFGGGGICGRISATLIHRPCHQDVDQPLTNSAVHWVKCCLIALQAIARVMVGQKSVITKERLIGQRFNCWTTRTSLKSAPCQLFRNLHFVCFHWVWKRQNKIITNSKNGNWQCNSFRKQRQMAGASNFCILAGNHCAGGWRTGLYISKAGLSESHWLGNFCH